MRSREEQREDEHRAVADAAYDAWRGGRNYDEAWDRAQDAIDEQGAYSREEAEEIAQEAAHTKRPEPPEEDADE